MTDEKLMSAEKAREWLGVFKNYRDGRTRNAARAALRTVIALHARAERAERERDEARAERDRLRHLRNLVAEEHEDCRQYAAWLRNPVRVGRCHVCDLLNTEAADAAREGSDG